MSWWSKVRRRRVAPRRPRHAHARSHARRLLTKQIGATRLILLDLLRAAAVKSIAEMGAYVSLLEYNEIEGMILLSELSRRRIRSINKLIRVGRIEYVVVLRVDKEKVNFVFLFCILCFIIYYYCCLFCFVFCFFEKEGKQKQKQKYKYFLFVFFLFFFFSFFF